MENSNVNDALGLGTWLGRRQAFSLLAGRCSAADAECLRKMRDEKQYRALGMSWATFCRTHVGVGRSAAEKIIKQLEEFGSTYFELAAVTRITPEEYRQIAGAVTPDGVLHRGRLLPIASENARELSEAVQELKQQAAPVVEEPPELERTLERGRKAVRAAVESYARAGAMELDGTVRLRLVNEIRDSVTAINRVWDEQLEQCQKEIMLST
jgi:hypothetical protein